MFNYDYTVELAAYRLTPVAKRQSVRLGFLDCIALVIQREHDLFFNDYVNGNGDAAYSNVTAYLRYDRVNYQNRIYEARKNNTGVLPADPDYWVQILGDFRGANERLKYNCQKLLMDYMLNKWFGTTFNQPADGNSDIWIETTDEIDLSLVMAPVNNVINGMGPTGFGISGMGPSHLFVTANFIVHYPLSVIPDSSDQYNQLVSLVNKYKLFGSTPSYQSY